VRLRAAPAKITSEPWITSLFAWGPAFYPRQHGCSRSLLRGNASLALAAELQEKDVRPSGRQTSRLRSLILQLQQGQSADHRYWDDQCRA
jgi:hypothetical protein